MDKTKLLEQLIAQLEGTLETLIRAANDAKEAATHEESKAENKYDTRGLESSYLAGAQAKRAEELQLEIEGFKKMAEEGLESMTEIKPGALVKLDQDEKGEEWFFMLPTSGGEKLEQGGVGVFVVTPSSPLGSRLIGKSVDDEAEVDKGGNVTFYTILEVL